MRRGLNGAANSARSATRRSRWRVRGSTTCLNGAANSARSATERRDEVVLRNTHVSMGPRIPRALRRGVGMKCMGGVSRSQWGREFRALCDVTVGRSVSADNIGLNGAANSARSATADRCGFLFLPACRLNGAANSARSATWACGQKTPLCASRLNGAANSARSATGERERPVPPLPTRLNGAANSARSATRRREEPLHASRAGLNGAANSARSATGR